MKSLKAILLPWVCILCAQPVCAAEPTHAIEAALSRLLARKGETFPFVIVEDTKTQKFVQFALDADAIFIDVPFTTLTPVEQTRASALFKELSRSAGTINAPLQGSKKTMPLETFQALFGTDFARAGRFAERVFSEVFLLKNPQLSIEESNQNEL